MIGELTRAQAEHMLGHEMIGRIGCHDLQHVYIVPVTYAFDGKHIYINSKEGLKVTMMRAKASVCFQIDRIEAMNQWRSVIVQGKFEELKSSVDIDYALDLLKERLSPYTLSDTLRPRGADMAPLKIEKDKKPVVYRIVIESISGRYEKP